MMTVEIRMTEEGLLVNAPGPRFLALARELDAVPCGDGWLFARQHEARIRQFCVAARRFVPVQTPARPSSTFESSIATLLDPLQPMSEHVKSAAALALALDPAVPGQLDEASAAFESFAARLREWASRGSRASRQQL